MTAAANADSALNLRVCWVEGTRYTHPLDATQDKKWRLLNDELGIDVFVISFALGWRPCYFWQHAHFYLLPALPAALLRYITFYALAPWLLLLLVLRHRVQIVVAHDPYFAFAGALVKLIMGWMGRRIALVIESHADFEVAVFLQRRMALEGAIRPMMGWVARWSLRRADALRAVSGSTRRQLHDWAPENIPMHQFLTWTDLDTFNRTPREKRPSECHDLIYVGVLIPRKGVHLLLDAFVQAAQDFPASHLWIVGSADNPGYAQGLVEQTARLGLESRVTFTGRLSQGELARRMGRCRALVLPSSSEGLPRVIVEAMLLAMPVVATSVSGIPDVIQDGVNGYLIPPEDVSALASALQRALSDLHVDAMGRRGRELVLTLFSTDAYLQGYRRLIEDAARTLAS